MHIQQNVSLRPFNTFGIDAIAKQFTAVTTLPELQEVLELHHPEASPMLVLGGGSNLLFTQDFHGLVVKNELMGTELVNEDADYYYVKAAAGENWHRFVQFCIGNNYAGVENLSLIPGNIGASPMQNIGAYGVEIKDVFYQLEAMHVKDRTVTTFNRNDCRFGYRDSVFKGKYKNQFVITSVTFRLFKTPRLNITYGPITQELEHMGVTDISIRTISQAVINIRTSKLPDPARIGNAGSFFKNPLVTTEQFQLLKEQFPAIVAFPVDKQYVKLAAGWLIEQCGWKGYRKGDAGCHEKQALVLVNYGNAHGMDIYSLSTEIMHSVESKFGVLLEREVNII